MKQKVTYFLYTGLLKLTNKANVKLILKALKLSFDFEDQQFWYGLKPFLKPPVFGLEMYALLQNSKICINSHGGVAGDFAANMRLFEATGVGTCLVTDEKQNMNELFMPGVECVTYKNEKDAQEKLHWLLDNPADLAAIGRAGQEKCLHDHTYDARAQQLHKIIQTLLLP